jgi:ABC-2 type transport system ATP-binding protein
VPGEANLWPALTGAETLHLLGRVHGQVDSRYRDELTARFDLSRRLRLARRVTSRPERPARALAALLR